MIENEEAKAGLDVSSEFLFANNFANRVVLGVITLNLRENQYNSPYILYNFIV